MSMLLSYDNDKFKRKKTVKILRSRHPNEWTRPEIVERAAYRAGQRAAHLPVTRVFKASTSAAGAGVATVAAEEVTQMEWATEGLYTDIAYRELFSRTPDDSHFSRRQFSQIDDACKPPRVDMWQSPHVKLWPGQQTALHAVA